MTIDGRASSIDVQAGRAREVYAEVSLSVKMRGVRRGKREEASWRQSVRWRVTPAASFNGSWEMRR